MSNREYIKKYLIIGSIFFLAAVHFSTVVAQPNQAIVQQTINDLMRQYQVPGAAVVVIDHGQSFIYMFGVANQASKQQVTNETLFQLGSLTKLLTTLLLAEEIQNDGMQLKDKVAHYLPELKNSTFWKASTLGQLATYTASLPVTTPQNITTLPQLHTYLQNWQPQQPNNATTWQYSDLGIGLLGYVLQNKCHGSLTELYQTRIFKPLGMASCSMEVPQQLQEQLAQGYTEQGQMATQAGANVLPAAREIKASIEDMQHFLAAAIGLPTTSAKIRSAMRFTQTPRVQVGDMQQALAWRVYDIKDESKLLPVLENKYGQPVPAQWLPEALQFFKLRALIDKVGVGDGFRAYIAVIPSEASGVVVLVNKEIADHVIATAGREILLQPG